jgi:hypothetical protein
VARETVLGVCILDRENMCGPIMLEHLLVRDKEVRIHGHCGQGGMVDKWGGVG